MILPMGVRTTEELRWGVCQPCAGGVQPFSAEQAEAQVKPLDGWRVLGGTRLRKEWVVQDFMAGVDFIRQVAEVAEAEGHHPDIHLERYRQVAIELSTHAIGGLSINDFILAAKIDQLPVRLKT